MTDRNELVVARWLVRVLAMDVDWDVNARGAEPFGRAGGVGTAAGWSCAHPELSAPLSIPDVEGNGWGFWTGR